MQAENICDFERLDGLLVAAEPDQQTRLEKESEAMRRAGFFRHAGPAPDTGEILSMDPRCGFRGRRPSTLAGMHGLACVHQPRRTPGLDSRAVEARVAAARKLDSGARLGAEHRRGHQHAIQRPGDDARKQAAYRTYVVGFDVPKDAFLPYSSGTWPSPITMCSVRGADRDVVIVGGEDHKTGQADDAAERYRRLERWARARFSVPGPRVTAGRDNSWSQSIRWVSSGAIRTIRTCAITGDSGDGMTTEPLAGC